MTESFWFMLLCCVGVEVVGCGTLVPTSVISSTSQAVAFVMSLEELQSNLRGLTVLSQMSVLENSTETVSALSPQFLLSGAMWKKILQ